MKISWKFLLGLVLGSLLLAAVGSPSVAAGDRVEKDVRIAQNDNIYWKIETRGTIEFTVDVLEGGAVDVLITKDLPVGYVLYYEKWTNVMNLDKSFKTGDDSEVYLLIDNTNDVGVNSVGDVRVRVEWETTGGVAGVFMDIILPLIVAIIIIISLVLGLASRRRSRRTTDEVIVEDIYVDETGRPVERVVSRQGGHAPRQGQAETEWCPNCGAQLRPHPSTGRLFCPQCATRARPPPRPPRQDE